MMFYASMEAALQDSSLIGYVSVIKRAWREMKLDGVLCLDGRPVLYLKEYARTLTAKERHRQQRLFWNQGVANVLVLVDPVSVYIHSGLTAPTTDTVGHADTEDPSLVQNFILADYVAQIQTMYHALATGWYYETHQVQFDPGQAVDMRLLNNLRAFRNELTQGPENLDIQGAHAFIGRILFLCYLLDRKIYSVAGMNADGTLGFTELLRRLPEDERSDALYSIFSDLKERFNGNMFDQNLAAEKKIIKPFQIEKLILFLGGHEVRKGQLSFWPYDFKMIPVETISAIYQDFLSAEDRGKQRKRGAFYTPRFLAEMVVDMAFAEDPNAQNGIFLDPACGSGIFLVILFNRIANHWVLHNRRASYTQKANALLKILSSQIYGVDLEETACRISCFSLYLAYLDFFDPPDIQEYIERTGQPLPKLLDYGEIPDRPKADMPVIHRLDFLDEGTFVDRIFDFIIGNPPWEGRGSKQLAQKFMEKVPGMLREGGTGCLLLPTKILQNQTDTFQAEWLTRVTLEEVLQLADYRFLLFQNAICPAFIARFKNIVPDRNRHTVEFNAPKFNRDGLRQGIIKIDPASRTWIPLTDILDATNSKLAPVVWKRRFWGSPRDQKLLDFLMGFPPLSDLTGNPNEGKRWIKGQGFQPYYPDKAKSDPAYPKPKPNPWGLDSLLMQPDQTHQMLLIQDEGIQLGSRLEQIGASFEYLRRSPSPKLFKAPMVLVSQGFGKVAFCDFNVLFQHSLQSISGPEEDVDLLMFLTGYLRSKLSRYFLFHTSANWGSERDKVHLNELLRVPFPLLGSEYVSIGANHIVELAAKRFEEFRKNLLHLQQKLYGNTVPNGIFDQTNESTATVWRRERKKMVDHLQGEMEPLIYQYFGLTDQEIALVEDTNNIFIPSSTPHTRYSAQTFTLNPTEKAKTAPYSGKGLSVYADTLTETLNHWAEGEGGARRVSAEGGTDSDTGLAMVTIYLSKRVTPYRNRIISSELAGVLSEFQKHTATNRGTLKYERDVLFFQGDVIHIIRPNILINWTRTAALNDAARIYGEIVLSGKES